MSTLSSTLNKENAVAARAQSGKASAAEPTVRSFGANLTNNTNKAAGKGANNAPAKAAAPLTKRAATVTALDDVVRATTKALFFLTNFFFVFFFLNFFQIFVSRMWRLWPRASRTNMNRSLIWMCP
jgi:hypothetical protein